MTRRIKRQRHRRRRSGSFHDPVDLGRGERESPDPASQGLTEDTGEYSVGDEDSIGREDSIGQEDSASQEDSVGSSGEDDAVQLELNEALDDSASSSAVPETAEAEELEDTAADPALERGGKPRSSRSRFERSDSNGTPVADQPASERVREHEDPDHPEAFGRWLRSQRELRGIHLRAIAENSKIGLGHLKALEAGRFDLLPAEVFTKGFLRQYAGYVGLDPEEAINFYLAAREHVDDEEDSLGTQPPAKASGSRWVVVALILAAVLLGVIWGLGRLSDSSQPEGIAPAGSAQRPAPVAVERNEPTTEPGDSESSPADIVDRIQDGTAPDGASETSDMTTESGPIAPSQPPAPAQSVQPADVPLRLVLDFSDTCWVSALIDGGETREKVHAQGESLTLDARSSVELKVGNYRAVEVEVNGMAYDLGSQGRPGSVVRTVIIDLESVRELRSETGFGALESTRSDPED